MLLIPGGAHLDTGVLERASYLLRQERRSGRITVDADRLDIQAKHRTIGRYHGSFRYQANRALDHSGRRVNHRS